MSEETSRRRGAEFNKLTAEGEEAVPEPAGPAETDSCGDHIFTS